MVNSNLKRKPINEKGSVLLTVIVISAVMIIIGAAIANAVVQRYKIARTQEHVEYTYIAGETAIERTFYYINEICKDSTLTNSMTYTDEENFANLVVSQIEDKLYDTYVPGLTYDGINGIEVLDDSTFKAKSTVLLKRMRQTKLGNEMKIVIGVTSKTSLTRGIYSSLERKVFAEREFTVTIPTPFKLTDAVCTIGDMIIDNGISARIKGDVNVYGTSPYYKSQPQQYFYGGIYAKNNSSLVIDGNAYTRSFIRTGKYLDSPPDDISVIHILKDAVAQCVQIFGKKNTIAVDGNVYTFDDVEIDGEDSVIAINGSFFGLNSGGTYHDESSAVVNAAPIHYAYSGDSLKSRIVINGDVLINGETLKIDTVTNIAKYKMESASLAWENTDDIPAYKYFDAYMSSEPDYLDWLSSTWVADPSHSRLNGFLNLFQVFPSLNSLNSTQFTDWMTAINFARSPSPRANYTSSVTGGAILLAPPASINGFCSKAIAANDRLYFMDVIDEGTPEIQPLGTVNNGGYNLENAMCPGGIVGGWPNFWPKNDGTYNSSAIPGKLTTIKGLLTPITEKLVRRDYSDTSDPAVIKHAPVNSPNNLYGDYDNLFLYLQGALNTLFPDSTGYVKVYGDDSSANDETYEPISIDPSETDKYHLIINNDPTRVLQVTSKFNGIIFTMGRVEIGKGAEINGSILAAGRGYDPGAAGVSGSAADMYDASGDTLPRVPVIKSNADGSSNLNYMENSSYAAVLFDRSLGDPSDSDPSIVFPGRVALLDALKNQDEGIDLYSIF